MPDGAALNTEVMAACCVVCSVFYCAACLFSFLCVFHSPEQKTCGAVTVVSISSPASIATDRGMPHPGMSVSVLARAGCEPTAPHTVFCWSEKRQASSHLKRDASFAACLPRLQRKMGINPPKNAFPKNSLPTAYLPKATLLFSLLLPAVKLMMKIPSCITPALPLNARRCSAQCLRRCLQYMRCCQHSPSRFCLPRNFKVHHGP